MTEKNFEATAWCNALAPQGVPEPPASLGSFEPAVPLPVLQPSNVERAALAEYRPKSDAEVDATLAAIEVDSARIHAIRGNATSSEIKMAIARRQELHDKLAAAEQEIIRLKAIQRGQ